VIRRLALFIGFAALAAPECRADAAAVQVQDKADISADHTAFDLDTGDTILSGNALIVDSGLLLTADEIRLNEKTQTATASGHVVLTQVGDRILADQLTLHRKTGTFSAINLRVGRFPYYIEGESAEGGRNEVVVHNATVIFREPGPWQPTIKARTITYSAGHYLRMAGASFGIGNYRPLPVSHVGEELSKQSSNYNFTLDGGYRHSLGAYADVAVNIPVVAGATAGPDIGIYTFRGLMLGPVANYNITSGDDTAVGYLKSGYIYDFGDPYPDILGNAVPASRAYVEWHHNQSVTQDLTLDADVNWSTDSEVVREFHSKDFVPVQEPDNFLEATYTQPDYLASAFTRFQPDAYYPVQERLPELRFDLLPTALGGGIYVRFNAGLAHLEEHPPAGGADLAADRFDTFAGLTRPFSYKGIFDVTPVVGGRFTQYWDTVGAADGGGTGRALGELGFDADLKMSAVFDYNNPLWHIDGLRHLLTPTLSYRYIPDGDKSADWIPPIDRSTFTNYLPIMELGDMRAIDQLQAANVLRLGLNNTLQTRDKDYGSRDLLSFNVAEDFRFQRAPGQTDFSDVHADLVATPAHWLEFRLEDTVSTERAAQRAIDADVILKEGALWSARFGVGYLSDNYGQFFVPGLGYNPIIGVDTYHWELRKHLNEVYEVFTRGDYDARDHIFVDQYYGVVQRISNTWLLEYALVFSQGLDNEQGHFGVEVTLNILRF
jgi:LPS-assembly protein